MTELETKILHVLQHDLPLVPEPYAAIAAELGISEQDFLACVQNMVDKGLIRRLGAVLNHRRIGYTANALCVWAVPAEQLETVAAHFVKLDCVTHCYERIIYPQWPYNLYTMLHAESRQALTEIVADMSYISGIKQYSMFHSLRELKKVSMKYDLPI